jgi:hypothetical protein
MILTGVVIFNRSHENHDPLLYIRFFSRVANFAKKKGKLVHVLVCVSYFLRFSKLQVAFLWHTISNIISTCFIFSELKMVARNAKIRLLRKNGYTVTHLHLKFSYIDIILKPRLHDFDTCYFLTDHTKIMIH